MFVILKIMVSENGFTNIFPSKLSRKVIGNNDVEHTWKKMLYN